LFGLLTRNIQMKKSKELTSLSFFSGCLGLDLGLEKAGIHQLLACDFDKHCRNTIATNKPDMPVIDDIQKYEADDIRKLVGLKKNQRPTLIVGGPPCQAFSTAGKRQAFSDPRGNVFLKYIQLIEELQPDYAVIENVRGLLSAAMKHRPHEQRTINDPPLSKEEMPGGALDFVISWLERIGYTISFNLYNSANYGVPQVRERVILIAARNGKKVPYIRPTHSDDPSFGLPEWTTFRQAVKGLKEKDMTHLNFPEDRLKYYRMLKDGQYWKHLPTEELKLEAMGNSYYSGGGKTGFYRRIAWDKPSPTLVTSPIMPATDLAHPEKDRPLSIQEYKRVQMFPDNWILTGSLTEQYKQVGNAVPVGLGEAVGRTLIDHLNGVKYDKDEFEGFPYSRYKNTHDVSWRAAFKRSYGEDIADKSKKSKKTKADLRQGELSFD
jgi:DNA (cytosine-5)-methyltransferase 1